MYLVDTNVISEARRRSPQAISWLKSVDPANIYISVITLGEITRGIVVKHRTDPATAKKLEFWLDTLQRNYGDRVLPITYEIARAWGRLSAGRTRGHADGLIAATAVVHDCRLVTRNVRDFVDVGVTIVDPWAS